MVCKFNKTQTLTPSFPRDCSVSENVQIWIFQKYNVVRDVSRTMECTAPNSCSPTETSKNKQKRSEPTLSELWEEETHRFTVATKQKLPDKAKILDVIDKNFKSTIWNMLEELEETMNQEIKEMREMMYKQNENINKETESIKRKT